MTTATEKKMSLENEELCNIATILRLSCLVRILKWIGLRAVKSNTGNSCYRSYQRF